MQKPRKVIIKCNFCPGDLCVLSAAIYSLHVKFKNQFQTDLRILYPEIFEGNPYITKLSEKERGVEVIEAECKDLLNFSNMVPFPYLLGFVQNLSEKLNIRLTLAANKPMLYLTDEEKGKETFSKPFWLINAGLKKDCLCKQWPVKYYQEVVNRFKDEITFVQIGDLKDRHTLLKGVANHLGQTTIREMMVLASQAEGGIGPVTWLQHLCAAFEKPYFCLLGGRESVSWVQYPLQQTFHTMGQLDCCKTAACWKVRLLRSNIYEDEYACSHPDSAFDPLVPKCMAMIKPEEVVCGIKRYLASRNKASQ
jgi:hypothetical protein